MTTLQERNKIIATFMGGKYRPVCIFNENTERFYMPNCSGMDYISNFEEDTPYHQSWDWLMPVVIKIKDYYVGWIKEHGTPVDNRLQKCIDDLKFELTVRLDIEYLHAAVCRFINWLNQTHAHEQPS